MLITQQPQAKLEEVEVKESSEEEKEIMGSRSRDGGMVVMDTRNIREKTSRVEKSGSQYIQSENLLFLLLIMYE